MAVIDIIFALSKYPVTNPSPHRVALKKESLAQLPRVSQLIRGLQFIPTQFFDI